MNDFPTDLRSRTAIAHTHQHNQSPACVPAARFYRERPVICTFLAKDFADSFLQAIRQGKPIEPPSDLVSGRHNWTANNMLSLAGLLFAAASCKHPREFRGKDVIVDDKPVFAAEDHERVRTLHEAELHSALDFLSWRGLCDLEWPVSARMGRKHDRLHRRGVRPSVSAGPPPFQRRGTEADLLTWQNGCGLCLLEEERRPHSLTRAILPHRPTQRPPNSAR